MLKIFLVTVISIHLVFTAESEFKPQTRALPFTYNEGSVAAYPVFTTIIYRPGATVDYIAGATVIYLSPSTTITFLDETEVYRQNGPETIPAGTDVVFTQGTQVSYGPGTSVLYATAGETRYAEFNGNTHAIASYPKQTSVQYYTGPRGNNLILFPPTANPLSYYNPGGSTQFGPSALPVEKDPELTDGTEAGSTTRTYGRRGGGYSYCSGYSNQGWPRTRYYNRNTGYRGSCNQNGPNNYNYGNNNNNGGNNNGGNNGGNGTTGGGNGGGYNGGYGK